MNTSLPAQRRRRRIGLAVATTYVVALVVGVRAGGGPWLPLVAARHFGAEVQRVRAASPTAHGLAAPVVLGRPEGCVTCHTGVSGLAEPHRPEAIGCASCHRGDIATLNATRAHRGMVRVPGNLADAPQTCGQSGCHPTIVPRVQHSIMTTMAGVVAVDRRVLGSDRRGGAEITQLGPVGADAHLRQLCASCHLGADKREWGPITEASRGGGCNACHLVYGGGAAASLTAYQKAPAGGRVPPRAHPDLRLAVDDSHCFGCHSRSSRIATSYAGWHELREPPTPAQLARADQRAAPAYRQLVDGRFFGRQPEDLHHEWSLACIDCHTANELMGSGAAVARKHEQTRIECADCHRSMADARGAAAGAPPAADLEPLLLRQLRREPLAPGETLARTSTGDVLSNVTVAPDGAIRLRSKLTGREVAVKPPVAACTGDPGHRRLACEACHTAWAPRCVSCHTHYDRSAEAYDLLTGQPTRGAWQETAGPFEAAPPTLGVRRDPTDPRRPDGVIETFVPGMILTVSGDEAGTSPPRFSRLYARISAHTTRREVRSCVSCHADPVALGFGAGALRFVIRDREGRWQFTPEESALRPDGLPDDAWTGFLQSRTGVTSTRDDVRPFNAPEQKRILTVGACLTCHPGDSAPMRSALADFAGTLARRGPRCVVPTWD